MPKQTDQRSWREYRPTLSGLAWSCAACVALALTVGFTWGGWMTQRTAERLAVDAAREGRAQLAATICIDQFMSSPDATTKLASLKAADSWSRESLIEKGGWAILPGMKDPIADAAEACATRLASIEAPG